MFYSHPKIKNKAHAINLFPPKASMSIKLSLGAYTSHSVISLQNILNPGRIKLRPDWVELNKTKMPPYAIKPA